MALNGDRTLAGSSVPLLRNAAVAVPNAKGDIFDVEPEPNSVISCATSNDNPFCYPLGLGRTKLTDDNHAAEGYLYNLLISYFHPDAARQ